MSIDPLAVPLLRTYGIGNKNSPKSNLETIPKSLYTEIAKYLPARESWILGKGLSKQISDRFDFKELEAAWKKNPAVRQVYEKYLNPASKWTDLKKILRQDLKLARQMAIHKLHAINLPEQRYLKKDSPLFDKYFHEFEQIAYIISQQQFLDSSSTGCCSCLEKWEWSIPMRNETFCTPCNLVKSAGCLYTASNITLATLGCCLSIPASAFWGTSTASTTLPFCYTYIRKDQPKQFKQALERFKAILDLDLPGKLKAQILALPRLLEGERFNREQFIQQVIEIIQTAESIQTSKHLPGLEALCVLIKAVHSNSRSATLEDLGLLNRIRFVASKALNQNILPPLSNEERELIQNFPDFEMSGIQSFLLKHLSNVNHPDFLPLLVHPNFNEDHFRLFLTAGLELESIPIDELTPRLLFQLLDQGIFVNHPRILDYLSNGYRYDLALILSLYGYQSPNITRQLEYNAFVNFKRLQEIQSRLRTKTDSKEDRSLLCRATLKELLKNEGNVSMAQICARITLVKNQLQQKLVAEAAAAIAIEMRRNRTDRMRP